MTIQLVDISKVFMMDKTQVQALYNINLVVKKGEKIAITGKSGAGKSTLLHIIGTLDQVSSGKLLINDVDVAKFSDKRLSEFRNRNIGFVFQMNNLLNEFSAIENIMMPGLIRGMKKNEAFEIANKLIKGVGLEKRALHRPGELSGGEQQRVAIARAIFTSPQVLLADEPTGNLDLKTSCAIQDLLLELCDAHAITMLLVTHDISLAKRVPLRITMEDGRIVDRG